MENQTTLEFRFKDIEWCNRVWDLVDDHTLTCVDAWLCEDCGAQIMKNFNLKPRGGKLIYSKNKS